MKKLIVLGMFAFAGLMMSSCCNNHDCLIEKMSKTDDPKELAEISSKISELERNGTKMTNEQRIKFAEISAKKASKMMKDADIDVEF